MSTESEAQPGSPEFSEQGIADLLPKIVDVKNLLPSEKKVNLEERQETTRSQLATFLIYILAGTLTASFVLIMVLTIMSVFVDDRKV